MIFNENIGAYFGFPTTQKTVTFRVAISFISVDQALTNLAQEAPLENSNFDSIWASTSQIWESALSQIEVNNPNQESEDNLVKFYTALYHSLLAPTIFSEVGGSYLGFDRKVHQVVKGIKLNSIYAKIFLLFESLINLFSGVGQSNYYTDMSIWDVHRTQV